MKKYKLILLFVLLCFFVMGQRDSSRIYSLRINTGCGLLSKPAGRHFYKNSKITPYLKIGFINSIKINQNLYVGVGINSTIGSHQYRYSDDRIVVEDTGSVRLDGIFDTKSKFIIYHIPLILRYNIISEGKSHFFVEGGMNFQFKHNYSELSTFIYQYEDGEKKLIVGDEQNSILPKKQTLKQNGHSYMGWEISIGKYLVQQRLAASFTIEKSSSYLYSYPYKNLTYSGLGYSLGIQYKIL